MAPQGPLHSPRSSSQRWLNHFSASSLTLLLTDMVQLQDTHFTPTHGGPASAPALAHATPTIWRTMSPALAVLPASLLFTLQVLPQRPSSPGTLPWLPHPSSAHSGPSSPGDSEGCGGGLQLLWSLVLVELILTRGQQGVGPSSRQEVGCLRSKTQAL